MRRWWVAGVGALLALRVVAGCGASDPEPGTDAANSGPGPALSGELLVAAAASLTDVFEDLGAAFSARHPEVDVVLNLGSSSSLAAQLVEGAPGDVFASADAEQMQRVVDAGRAGDPAVVATTDLMIVVEPRNPLGITELADLARDEVVLVLAEEEVPAGGYAAEVLAAADVAVDPASLELDVRAVLGKVAAGEADAGLVYRSDVVAGRGRVEGVEIPSQHNVEAAYRIAVLDDADDPVLADAFVAFVRGDEGRRAFSAAGFTPT